MTKNELLLLSQDMAETASTLEEISAVIGELEKSRTYHAGKEDAWHVHRFNAYDAVLRALDKVDWLAFINEYEQL